MQCRQFSLMSSSVSIGSEIPTTFAEHILRQNAKPEYRSLQVPSLCSSVALTMVSLLIFVSQLFN